jgi:hypothetical protein
VLLIRVYGRIDQFPVRRTGCDPGTSPPSVPGYMAPLPKAGRISYIAADVTVEGVP